MLKALIAATTILGSAYPAHGLDDPDQLVRAIYDAPNLPTSDLDVDRVLARDAASAYKLQLKAAEPKPATDFDWRWDSQEWEIADLTISKGKVLPVRDGVAFSEVTVNFKSFGKPETVVWKLCLGLNGWRVWDAAGGDGVGAWTLRELLELRGEEVQC